MPAALGLMAGILLFYSSSFWFIPVAAILLSIIAFVYKRHWLTFFSLFIALGWLLSLSNLPMTPPSDLWNMRSSWTGNVTGIHSTSNATRLTAEIHYRENDNVTPFNCALLLPIPTDRFLPGDVVSFNAKLYNPDLSVDLPDENRLNPTFFVDGITAQANVSPDDIKINSRLPSLKRTALIWQSDVRDLIYDSPISSHTAWFLSATLIGDDSLLDQSLKQQFRATGAAHYLALSGFHIGIIAMLASFALFPLKIWSRYGRLRHLFVILIIWLYAFTCGLAPSLVRAAVLITIFLLAKVLQRQSSPYNSLCIAAICILSFSPRQLFAPGFQLSFCAVLSILAFSRLLNPIKNQRSRIYRVASFITVPVAAMLGTCLVSVYHFHRFPILFLIPNLILAVLLPILLSIGVALIISSAAGIKLTFIGHCADWIYDSIYDLSKYLASFHSAEIRGIFLAPATIILAFTSLIVLAVIWHYRKRTLLFLAVAILATSALIQVSQPDLPEAELYITRQPLRTDIVARNNDSVLILTTAPEDEYEVIARRLAIRYANYLSRRNCSAQPTIINSDFSLPSIKKRGEYLVFNDKTLLIPSTPEPIINNAINVNYLLISRSAGSRPFDIVKTVNPDTIIISRDVPSIRAQKLKDSCTTNGFPFIHLIDHPFSLIEAKQ